MRDVDKCSVDNLEIPEALVLCKGSPLLPADIHDISQPPGMTRQARHGSPANCPWEAILVQPESCPRVSIPERQRLTIKVNNPIVPLHAECYYVLLLELSLPSRIVKVAGRPAGR